MAQKSVALQGGRVMHIDVKDEKGRWTTYIVQTGPGNRFAIWTPETPGGSVTLPELYAFCCQRQAMRERDGK
jgi:hypothetical protein